MNLENPYVIGLQFFGTSTISTLSPTAIIDYEPFPYYNLGSIQWLLLFGVSFIMSMGIGANDVADAFGTSVGTGAVTVTQAFILATVVEMMGSVARGLGNNDEESLRVIETSMYQETPDELVIGHIAMLIGCSIWLIIATFNSLPVSFIHSLLGATMGFTFVLRGFQGIVWERIRVIVLVWLLSPIASALVTIVIFFLIDHFILQRKDPVKTGLFYLPAIYLIAVFIKVFLVVQDGSKILPTNDIPFMYTLAISLICGVIAGFFALFVVGPIMKRRLETESEETRPRITFSLSYTSVKKPKNWIRKAVLYAFPALQKDDKNAVRLFSFLQLLTACFAGFVHGAKDISNSIAPLRDLVLMYNQEYNEDFSNIAIEVYVGVLSTLAVLLGIWTLGTRVVGSFGEELSKMNPATGFAMQFGAAVVALGTNAFDVPVSMTHCLFGSICGLGLVRSGPILKWKMVKYVFLSWLLTIPVSGLLSAAVMYALQTVILFLQDN